LFFPVPGLFQKFTESRSVLLLPVNLLWRLSPRLKTDNPSLPTAVHPAAHMDPLQSRG
jgi:hypothetical protein